MDNTKKKSASATETERERKASDQPWAKREVDLKKMALSSDSWQMKSNNNVYSMLSKKNRSMRDLMSLVEASSVEVVVLHDPKTLGVDPPLSRAETVEKELLAAIAMAETCCSSTESLVRQPTAIACDRDTILREAAAKRSYDAAQFGQYMPGRRAEDVMFGFSWRDGASKRVPVDCWLKKQETRVLELLRMELFAETGERINDFVFFRVPDGMRERSLGNNRPGIVVGLLGLGRVSAICGFFQPTELDLTEDFLLYFATMELVNVENKAGEADEESVIQLAAMSLSRVSELRFEAAVLSQSPLTSLPTHVHGVAVEHADFVGWLSF